MYERMRQEREKYQIFARGGKKDYWAYTYCAGCYGHCAVMIRVVDGVPVEIRGVPDTDQGGRGGLCGKGVATLLDFHDPNRIKYPLKRTGRKGLGEDPKWVRISWEEAMETIAEKLKKVRAEDPRKVFWAFTPGHGTGMKATQSTGGFWTAFGSPNMCLGGPGCQCGAVAHHLGALHHASWDILPDYRYNNFLLRCGGNEGTGGGRIAMTSARQFADARARGQITWCLDPLGFVSSAAKAQEWIPILPGTDAAVFLAIANIIMFEIKKFDVNYIKHYTNAPYIADASTGKFIRKNGKPILYDLKDKKFKTYDDKTLTDPAIDGEFVYKEKDKEIKVKPCWEFIKAKVRQWTPERAEKESTVPAQKIREIAYKLVEEAKIGSTIMVDGVEVPYRPAGLCAYKGSQGHENGFHQHATMYLINQLLGNQDAAGGIKGEGTVRCFGHPETGKPKFYPYATTDGMLTPYVWHTRTPWPPREVNMKGPSFISLLDLLADATFSPYPYCEDWEEVWKNAGWPYTPEIFFSYGGNIVRNLCNSRVASQVFKHVSFCFMFCTTINETAEAWADIVLPECHNYESLEAWTTMGFFFSYPIGMDDWCWHLRMPVIPPTYERRDGMDIFLDLSERVGFRDVFNDWIDTYLGIREPKWEQDGAKDLGEKHITKRKFPIVAPEERILWYDIVDRTMQYHMGKNIEWFIEHGYITWKKDPRECYWRWFLPDKPRVPVYYEHHLHTRPKLEQKAKELNWKISTRQWVAEPDYFRPLMYETLPGEPEDWRESEYNLITVTYRDVLHAHATSTENPWVDEMSKNNPYSYNWVMHHDMAKKKGIKDGDWIVVENLYGDKVAGRVKLSWLIHPHCIAAVGLGNWAKGRPIARDKGIRYNELLRGNARNFDSITGSFEDSARVKVYRVEGEELKKVLEELGMEKAKEAIFS